jgi:hypothetical protein
MLESKVVVACLTPMYLWHPSCLLDIEWAMGLEKAVAVVVLHPYMSKSKMGKWGTTADMQEGGLPLKLGSRVVELGRKLAGTQWWNEGVSSCEVWKKREIEEMREGRRSVEALLRYLRVHFSSSPVALTEEEKRGKRTMMEKMTQEAERREQRRRVAVKMKLERKAAAIMEPFKQTKMKKRQCTRLLREYVVQA